MDLNKWNRSVGSFDKCAAEEGDNRENKIDTICKASKNLSKAHDHEQQEQNNDNDNENSVTNEDENKTAATIIISPLNRTLLKKPTPHKNANNYNNNLNDNNNNNKNNNLNSENLTCNINCSVNENDYQCKTNDYQFSKPITKNLKQQPQQQHNHNFISKRAENTFVCPMLEKCASANFPNSSSGSSSSSSHVESDNEQEQEQENSKAQAQLQQQLQTQENQNDRPVDVDDVDATNKLSSRNAAAHITGFETGVVGVCCGSISVGASVDFAAIGDSSNSSFILNLHKKPNLAVTSITTTTTTNTIENVTTTTTTTTNASNDHNSTNNANETSVTAKCHNCCNNNNNNNINSSNNNNSSNYCRN